MEQLLKLLTDLQQVTFQDMSEIPEDHRHHLLIRIEELQDHLRKATEKLY